jgi:hypothetical protein
MKSPSSPILFKYIIILFILFRWVILLTNDLKANKEIFFWKLSNKTSIFSGASQFIIEGKNCSSRSVKAAKSTTSRIIQSISRAPMQEDHDYDERKFLSNQIDWERLGCFAEPCPSFDLHLYAHVDHSSLNRCVFTPVPHQTGDNINSFS